MENEHKGLYLLKKGRRGLMRVLFSRFFLLLLLIGFQIAMLAALLLWLQRFIPGYLTFSSLFTTAMVIYLINSRIDPTAKITWMAVILAAPVPGSLLLLFTKADVGHRALKRQHMYHLQKSADAIPQSAAVMEHLTEVSPESAELVHYIARTGCFRAFDRTEAEYLPSGEAKFDALLRELERAEKFIFMEYFIIREGHMWGRVLEVLAKKAAEGVEVRVMYDGRCEFAFLPHNYPRRLEALGIRCRVFAPLAPFVSTHYNYRDHRKIVVIDGRVGFTGGVNLADEYINREKRFGHWKDASVLLRGEAVRGLTLMFLQMWYTYDPEPEKNAAAYLTADSAAPADAEGFVVPYSDCPLDGEKVGERVYMDILERARRYVHIMTPYLILDQELEAALIFAAKRGVEVSIVLPGIPDKPIPYALAYTHYAPLLEAGVKIFEYTPGFVHAKVFVSDDKCAVVGTINLDYRSLYHHFECAAYLCRTPCVADIERDFQETLPLCRRITPESMKQEKFGRKLTGVLMKVFAPLL